MKADETVYPDATPLSPTHPMSTTRDGDAVIGIDSRNGMVMRGRPDGRGAAPMMRLEILQTSMPALAEYLTGLADRPVVAATGLKGLYRMTLDIPINVYMGAIMSRPMPADVAAALGRSPFGGAAGTSQPVADAPVGNASDPPGKAVFAAIEKVGLKLASRKVPIETLIIEHVERNPTEN
jgi:uncharacterized protein (TIGR03435 family)